MLYVTTRDDKDAYTPNRTLHMDLAPDGGSFVPFHLPAYGENDVNEFLAQPFGQIVSEILNVFYGAKFTAWDVDMAIGRNPIQLVSISQKILIAEIWHNPLSSIRYAIENLYLKATDSKGDKPTVWFETTVYIAFLFGIFGEMKKQNMPDSVDIAVDSGNMAMMVALLYAEKMGLPISKKIVSCKDGGAVWDVFRRGLFPSAAVDTEKILLEQIIYNYYDPDAVKKYLFAKADGRVYTADIERAEQLKNHIFAAAVSQSRIDNVISSVMRTDSYKIGADTALIFGGLYDYRASTRENKLTLVLIEDFPK